MGTPRALLFWLVLILLPRLALGEPPVDVVVDLDGVLLLDENQGERAGDFIVCAGRRYRVAEGAREFLGALFADRRLRVSFFSGHASEARNQEAIRQIQPAGQTKNAFELCGGRVFSGDHITDVRGSPVKDITRVARDVDLARALLIDDVFRYAAPGQERNVLWAGYADNHTRLARVLGLLDRALAAAARDGVSLRDALDRQQWRGPPGSEAFRTENETDAKLLERGLELFRAVNPKYTPPAHPNVEPGWVSAESRFPPSVRLSLYEAQRNGRIPRFADLGGQWGDGGAANFFECLKRMREVGLPIR